MIKKILFGTFCIAQISLVYANNIDKNPVSTLNSGIELYQKVPKTVIIKTKKFKIRIDQQPNGKYLYQSWPANAKITSKPSMIISNGELIPDGSGGNYYYQFTNKGYTYQVWRNYLTEGTMPPYTLMVSDQTGKTIVNQDGQVVKK
ncbi:MULTISPECIES: hypothetical protein [Chryseobacterium]|uniref:Bulb-type lectin domain-containing protein n=1 Tax=Chryseobacterium geocarposphaerae TaxID=1416776 RepID=A0ABU1LBC7_9FLAO|nr:MULTISPECIES: hypothetical protein [Chryseobacterium]MDR6404026.1 hypothetical protein [Chryseobacterium geocarposphaerae]MDR6698455.1 hypothetical protein [Chryseobacterium ginsenosidimutans]